jgi:ABC-type methionine transport system ATPase subunit
MERRVQSLDLTALQWGPLLLVAQGKGDTAAALARALVSTPNLLLLDEPTSALDRVAEELVLSVVDEIRARGDVGVILITHSLHVAGTHASRVLLLDKDDRVVETGSFEEVSAGANFRRLYGLSHAAVADCGGH